MWALGVIVYMMLIGHHPFDLECDASDEEIGRRINTQRQPALKDCPFTQDISPLARDLLSKLMEPDPKKRMMAHDMLHHPWVTGETASEYVMEDSAKRLKQLHRYPVQVRDREDGHREAAVVLRRRGKNGRADRQAHVDAGARV
jgi:serine/threonine protein kinase